MASPSSEITQLLVEWRTGNEGAKENLFSVIYDVLRRLAHKQRAQWRGSDTLNTTALVNELYLKLDGKEQHTSVDRQHFFNICAKAMRHILIDYAKKVTRKKRGEGRKHLSLEDANDVEISVEREADELLDLDRALSELEESHAQLSELVALRYFAGLSCKEIADLRGVKSQTVSRDWLKARAILKNFLES